jgi:3-deoxy-manno-octulosonate cytidylyltransferase (CMP-KDO synthetase)
LQVIQHPSHRRPFLLALASLPPEPLEQLKKLEQLGVLALGRRIQVGVIRQAAAGVDTHEDYERFVRAYRQRRARRAA